MKKIFFVIVVFFLFICSLMIHAREQEPEWVRVLQLSTYGNQVGQLVTANKNYGSLLLNPGVADLQKFKWIVLVIPFLSVAALNY
jgi:hypothetical protein